MINIYNFILELKFLVLYIYIKKLKGKIYFYLVFCKECIVVIFRICIFINMFVMNLI